MSRYFLILWILYTGLMGIFVGASFDSEFFVSQNYRNGEQQNSAGNQKSLEERQEITNKALVDYTKWLMRYTGLLFAATLGMGIATIGLYASGQDQIRLARAEFLSTHRPRLRLKAMWLTSPDGEISAPALQVRSPLTVRLDIANWGNTTAYIHRINLLSLIIPFGQQLPQRPPYNESNDQGFEIFNVAVISGQTFTRAFSDGYRLSPQDLRTIQGGERRLYFVGTIDYRDGNGLPRQTGFCRYLHFLNLPPTAGDHGRFRAIDDPDPHYEYQD